MTIIAEGKTKIIHSTNDAYLVDVESKPAITAGDGARRDVIVDKDVLATTTTCNCFTLLAREGIQTHFLTRLDTRTFRAVWCDMIPVESVARAIATGSYLKRNPDVVEGELFSDLVTEFFWKDDTRHDPMMVWQHEQRKWLLHVASKPVGPDTVIGEIKESMTFDYGVARAMRSVTQRVFRILQAAWAKQDVALVDLKIEFGIDRIGKRLFVADVIDNDSWRIWPAGDKAQAKDKQVYRDLQDRTPQELGKIKENYAWVTEATKAFLVR